MASANVVLCPDLCRLCLCKSGVKDIHKNTDLEEDIYLCTGVKITTTNIWLRKICLECLEIVTKAKHLRLLATANDTGLKKLSSLGIKAPTDGKEGSSMVTDVSSSSESQNNTNKEELDKFLKRHRSNSLGNEEPSKKVAMTKDLFKSPNILPTPPKEFIEDTKYGITKKYVVNDEDEIDITYTCMTCAKTFTTWKKVYCHQRSHTKKLSCAVCMKMFTYKADLNKHIRTHTGERPYNCDVCGRSYTQQSTLKIHLDSDHHKAHLKKKKLSRLKESSDPKASSEQQVEANEKKKKEICDLLEDSRDQPEKRCDQQDERCDQQEERCDRQPEKIGQQEERCDQQQKILDQQEERCDQQQTIFGQVEERCDQQNIFGPQGKSCDQQQKILDQEEERCDQPQNIIGQVKESCDQQKIFGEQEEKCDKQQNVFSQQKESSCQQEKCVAEQADIIPKIENYYLEDNYDQQEDRCDQQQNIFGQLGERFDQQEKVVGEQADIIPKIENYYLEENYYQQGESFDQEEECEDQKETLVVFY